MQMPTPDRRTPSETRKPARVSDSRSTTFGLSQGRRSWFCPEQKWVRRADVRKPRWSDKRVSDRGEYASKEVFVSVFESKLVALRPLALLLTANPVAANRCLVLAYRDCLTNCSVSKNWALAWARRLVIRKAIDLVMN